MLALFNSIYQSATSSLAVQCVIIILTICTATRVLSGRKPKSCQSSPPHWVPYLGHFPHLFSNPQSFVTAHADYVEDGCLHPYVLGRKVTLILSTSLTESLLSTQASDPSSPSNFHFRLFKNVFGAPSSSKSLYEYPGLRLPDVVSPMPLDSHTIVKLISSRLPDLLTFNAHIVDQEPWERPAAPGIVPHPHSLDRARQAARVSLVTLVTHFVGHALGTVTMGADFMDQYPQFIDDLVDLDGGFKYLALGWPRWIPPTNVALAYIARKRLLAILSGVQKALDQNDCGEEPEELWGAVAEDLGAGVKDWSRALREKGASADLRASLGLAAVWSMFAQVSSLTIWMLINIWSTSDLWARITLETSEYAKVKKGIQIMALSSSNRIELDEAGLRSACPLLSTCFSDCLRRYQWPQAVILPRDNMRLVTHDYRPLHLDRGSIVMCGLSPAKFDLGPFNELADSSKSDSTESLRGKGLVQLSGTSRDDALADVVLAAVAGIIALWEIMPATSRSLPIPTLKFGSPCARPVSAFQVVLAQKIIGY